MRLLLLPLLDDGGCDIPAIFSATWNSRFPPCVRRPSAACSLPRFWAVLKITFFLQKYQNREDPKSVVLSDNIYHNIFLYPRQFIPSQNCPRHLLALPNLTGRKILRIPSYEINFWAIFNFYAHACFSSCCAAMCGR